MMDNKNNSDYKSFLLRFFNEDKNIKEGIERLKPKKYSLNQFIIEILKNYVSVYEMKMKHRGFKEIKVKMLKKNAFFQLPTLIKSKNIDLKIKSSTSGIYLERVKRPIKIYKTSVRRFFSRLYHNKRRRYTRIKPLNIKGRLSDSRCWVLDKERGVVAITSSDAIFEDVKEKWNRLEKSEEQFVEILLEGGNLFSNKYILKEAIA